MKRSLVLARTRWLLLTTVTAAVLVLSLGAVLVTGNTSVVRPAADGTVSVFTTPSDMGSLANPSLTAASSLKPTNDPNTGGPCGQNESSKLLVISISQQHLWACAGTNLVNDSPVTTGTTAIVNGVDDATPTGTWSIYSKQTNQVLRGCDANGCWNDPVQYWMPFDGEVGFHDASWQTFPFGASNYTTDGSHGCVHLPTPFAAWVYSWAPVGTTVTIEN